MWRNIIEVTQCLKKTFCSNVVAYLSCMVIHAASIFYLLGRKNHFFCVYLHCDWFCVLSANTTKTIKYNNFYKLMTIVWNITI